MTCWFWKGSLCTDLIPVFVEHLMFCYPFLFNTFVVFYPCWLDTWNRVYSSWPSCSPSPFSLFLFLYSLLLEQILTRAWEALQFMVTARPHLRIMCVFVHVCMYTYWGSAEPVLCAVFLLCGHQLIGEVATVSSLHLPWNFLTHWKDLSLYSLCGYIDIRLENALKDRRTVMWSLCPPWRVIFWKKISRKFPLLLFFPSPNNFTNYWVSSRHPYTCERWTVVSLMTNYALLW